MASGNKKPNLFNNIHNKNKNLTTAQTKQSSSTKSDLILSSSYMSFNDLDYETNDYVSNNDHLTKHKRKHLNQFNRETREALASEADTYENHKISENQNNSIEIMNDLHFSKFKKFKSSRASSSASISSDSSSSSTSSKSDSSSQNDKLTLSSSNLKKDLLKELFTKLLN